MGSAEAAPACRTSRIAARRPPRRAAPSGPPHAGTGPVPAPAAAAARPGSRDGAPGPAPARWPAPSRAARSARLGSRAVCAAASRASSASPPAARICGAQSAEHRPGRGERLRPAAGHQAGRLGGPGEAADERGRAGAVRAERQHLAGVRVRRPRLGVQVVAVVPDHDQAELGDRREHRGPGARDDPDLAAPHRQPAAVPLRPGPRPAASVTWPARAEQAGQRGVHQVQVPGVRHHDQHAPARCADRAGRPGDLLRPVRPGQRGPDGARRPPAGQRGQEGGPAGYRAQGPGLAGAGRRPAAAGWPRTSPACQLPSPPAAAQPPAPPAGPPAAAGSAAGRRRSAPPAQRTRSPACRGGMASRSTSARVPAYRSATSRASARISGLSTGSGDTTRSSRASRPACSLAGALQQVPVDQLAGEPDPDPAAGHRLAGQPLRDQIVEGPVQVRPAGYPPPPGPPAAPPVRPGIPPPSPGRPAARLAVRLAARVPAAFAPATVLSYRDPTARPGPAARSANQPQRWSVALGGEHGRR